MTQTYHSPHVLGFDLTTTELERPLGELDAALGREADARAAADATIAVTGSGATTTLDGSAASGQKVIPLASTTGITPGESFFLTDGTNSESGIVATVSAGVSVTAIGNLAATYAAGAVFSLSSAELALARGGYRSLGERLTALGIHTADFCPVRDGTTDNTAGVQAAVIAAGTTRRLIWDAGTYLITDSLTVSHSYSWEGERTARGTHAQSAGSDVYYATTIRFRPVDTTKHLVQVSDVSDPAYMIGPFEHRNILFDLGDANGFDLGLDDGATVVDGAGQAYVFGVRFEDCAIEATAANRVSTAGVITRSGRHMIALTKCFEAVLQNVSLFGCDTQIKTWGCDKPVFRNVRSQGSHLPFDLNGSGTFGVQHTMETIQIEGWTFTPIRVTACTLSAVDIRTEQNDGAPTGSGRWAIPGTFTREAGTDYFYYSGTTLSGIVFPDLSLVELTDGTHTDLVSVRSIGDGTILYAHALDTDTTVLSVTGTGITATRIHGYGPINTANACSTYVNASVGASEDCPAFVHIVGVASMSIVNAAALPGAYGDIGAEVIGNRTIGAAGLGGTYTDSNLNLVNVSPMLVKDPDHPFVFTWPQRAIGGTQSHRQRYGDALGERLTARRWSWTPKDTATGNNDSHLVPSFPYAGDANTTQRVWAWKVQSTGPRLNLYDDTLPGVAGYLRLRIRARSLDAAADMVFHLEGNGSTAGATVALTDAWSTTESIIAVPAAWIGSKASAGITGIVFDVPASSTHDFALAAVSIEEITPASAYTITNVTPDRSCDADTVAVAGLADIVGTLIADLRSKGLVL